MTNKNLERETKRKRDGQWTIGHIEIVLKNSLKKKKIFFRESLSKN